MISHSEPTSYKYVLFYVTYTLGAGCHVTCVSVCAMCNVSCVMCPVRRSGVHQDRSSRLRPRAHCCTTTPQHQHSYQQQQASCQGTGILFGTCRIKLNIQDLLHPIRPYISMHCPSQKSHPIQQNFIFQVKLQDFTLMGRL